MPTRVAIGVCTAHRPDMLGRCLTALAVQAVPPGCHVTVIVVDNQLEPGNRVAVEAHAGACLFPIRYLHEPRLGIPYARNAVLDACEGCFDWVAFTDDDRVPAPDWIAALLAAAERYGADVVYGRREWLPPEGASFWHIPPTKGFAEGQRLQHAGTHNVLMAGALIALNDNETLRFDERLTHGEDTDFFYRAATRHGARIVYSDAPVVYECVPTHRATLRYHLRQQFYLAASRSDFQRRHKGLATALTKLAGRLAFQVPLAAVRLATAPLEWLFGTPRFRRTVVRNAGKLAAAAGALSGTAGYIGNPYRDTGADGPLAPPPHRAPTLKSGPRS
ncbi:MAG: glycosyltransferase family 2 protein [Hyphomicrobiaceae bacterium]|nr:glycosyltransferase family 2 protein [Hyphomicrobiaceae bacterium]